MSVENTVFTLVSLQYCCDNNKVKHTSKSLYFYIPLKWRLSWINTQLISDTYIFRIIIISEWDGIAKSVWRPATGRTVGESNPGGGEILTRPDRPWAAPNLLYNGYRVFPGSKAVGAWHWPPTPSSTKVKERVELYLYSTSGPSWPVLGWILPLPYV